MKKLLITAALVALSASAAHAEIDVNIGIGQPGYYVPAPIYVEPVRVYTPTYYGYGNDRHRNYDWSYWRQHREVRYVEQRHDDDDRYEHHDNGNRGNYQHRGNSGKSKGHK